MNYQELAFSPTITIGPTDLDVKAGVSWVWRLAWASLMQLQPVNAAIMWAKLLDEVY